MECSFAAPKKSTLYNYYSCIDVGIMHPIRYCCCCNWCCRVSSLYHGYFQLFESGDTNVYVKA